MVTRYDRCNSRDLQKIGVYQSLHRDSQQCPPLEVDSLQKNIFGTSEGGLNFEEKYINSVLLGLHLSMLLVCQVLKSHRHACNLLEISFLSGGLIEM